MNHTKPAPHDSSSAKLMTVIAAIIFLSSCSLQTPKEEAAVPDLQEQSSILAPPPPETPVVQEPVMEKPVEVPKTVSTRYFDVTPSTTKDNVKGLTYRVRPEVIDSLNRIVPLFDPEKYRDLAVNYFTAMAHDLNGRPYFVEHSDSLVDAVMDILTSRLNDGTDIVFLIDKTGSMDDDIANVKNGMGAILDYLKGFDNVKLGVAAYGDKNWHYDLWYNSIPLGYGVDKIQEFMDGFQTIGNPDIAESVNDAIVRTAEEMNWTPGNKRLMLVIGDAPSQSGSMSEHTSEQVVAKCKENNVTFNLYPLILSTKLSNRPETFVANRNFAKIYPNPVSDVLNLSVNDDASYFYLLNDLSGKEVRRGALGGRSLNVPVTDLVPGTYLVQIYNQNFSRYDSKQIIVQR